MWNGPAAPSAVLGGRKESPRACGRLALGGEFSKDSGCPYLFQEGLAQGAASKGWDRGMAPIALCPPLCPDRAFYLLGVPFSHTPQSCGALPGTSL